MRSTRLFMLLLVPLYACAITYADGHALTFLTATNQPLKVNLMVPGRLESPEVVKEPLQAQRTAGITQRPNVILIYTDDQDWDEVGCYGGKVATPNMDSLARDGMRFTRFYVASPVCTPSRYNGISGRYASRR